MKIGLKIIDNFEDVIFADTLPNDYTDITSVANFIKYGTFYFKDYKWLRKRFQEFTWDDLTADEKILVAQKRGTTIANCKSVLEDSYEYWMTDFDLQSVACRKHRFAFAKTVLIKNVATADLYTILGSLGGLAIQYSDYGVEGTTEGDPIEGLFNFIEATGSYSATGILAMTLTMLNSVTKEEMVAKMMDCLRNGNY